MPGSSIPERRTLRYETVFQQSWACACLPRGRFNGGTAQSALGVPASAWFVRWGRVYTGLVIEGRPTRHPGSNLPDRRPMSDLGDGRIGRLMVALQCVICHNPAHNAHMYSSCHHLVCESCSQRIADRKTCAQCGVSDVCYHQQHWGNILSTCSTQSAG
jgi:hypothetical protein